MINFKLFNQFRIRINQIRCDETDYDEEFGLKKSIKRQFEFDSRQNLGLSRFNRLSLEGTTPNKKTVESKGISGPQIEGGKGVVPPPLGLATDLPKKNILKLITNKTCLIAVSRLLYELVFKSEFLFLWL